MNAGARTKFSTTDRKGLSAKVVDSSTLDAWRRFGKGRHPASLNMGDCAAYALSRLTGQALLCVGDNFARTDIPIAFRTEAPTM